MLSDIEIAAILFPGTPIDPANLPTAEIAAYRQKLADEAAEEQKTKLSRQNIQFMRALLDANEQQITNWIARNGQDVAIVRLTQVVQFMLRWIQTRERRRPDLADK